MTSKGTVSELRKEIEDMVLYKPDPGCEGNVRIRQKLDDYKDAAVMAERERCANVCETLAETYVEGWEGILGRGTVGLASHIHDMHAVYGECAKAIRTDPPGAEAVPGEGGDDEETRFGFRVVSEPVRLFDELKAKDAELESLGQRAESLEKALEQAVRFTNMSMRRSQITWCFGDSSASVGAKAAPDLARHLAREGREKCDHPRCDKGRIVVGWDNERGEADTRVCDKCDGSGYKGDRT